MRTRVTLLFLQKEKKKKTKKFWTNARTWQLLMPKEDMLNYKKDDDDKRKCHH